MRKKYRNPKLVDTNLIDCKPQKGLCPMNCNQCFYNRVDSCPDCIGTGVICTDVGGRCPRCGGSGKVYASFVPIDKVHIPTKEDAEGKIVRMNSLHDSNIKRTLVLKVAKRYKHVFFNTSIPEFDELPGPIVYTANPHEEEPVDIRFLDTKGVEKLMSIRLRVSATNLHYVIRAVGLLTNYCQIPIILTFMAYYDTEPGRYFKLAGEDSILCYIWKKRHINEYWCPTRGFKRAVLKMMRAIAGRQVTMCGTLDSNYCRDCHNCESYYWITKRRLEEIEDAKGR